MKYARRQVLFGAVLVVVCVLAALALYANAHTSRVAPPPPPVSIPGGAHPGGSE